MPTPQSAKFAMLTSIGYSDLEPVYAGMDTQSLKAAMDAYKFQLVVEKVVEIPIVGVTVDQENRKNAESTGIVGQAAGNQRKC